MSILLTNTNKNIHIVAYDYIMCKRHLLKFIA